MEACCALGPRPPPSSSVLSSPLRTRPWPASARRLPSQPWPWRLCFPPAWWGAGSQTEWQWPESGFTFYCCLWTCRTFFEYATSWELILGDFCWISWLLKGALTVVFYACFSLWAGVGWGGQELGRVKVTILEIPGNTFAGTWAVKTVHPVTQYVSAEFLWR